MSAERRNSGVLFQVRLKLGLCGLTMLSRISTHKKKLDKIFNRQVKNENKNNEETQHPNGSVGNYSEQSKMSTNKH